jgi:type IV pilus assembly protein PilE
MRNLRNQRGFTLMELMVVIVIVAILAAVAVPLYINYVKDAKRTEAKGAIAAVISAEQVYFQNHENYTTEMDDLRVDLTDVQRNWNIQVSSASGTSFTVEATGQNDAANLYVCCTYDRTAAPVWGEAAGECGGGGGGGP